MPVYMIRAGEHGPVKIGYSHDPELRLSQLQVSHWETLRIIRQFDGDEAEEAMLHERFADQHLRGEWHHFTRSMLHDVGLVEILPAPPPVVEFVAPIQTILERAFSQRLAVTRIAERVGISTAAVSQWNRVPTRHLNAVAEITGIPVNELRPDLWPAAEVV